MPRVLNEELLLEGLNQGRSLRLLAEELGVSVGSLRHQLKVRGLKTLIMARRAETGWTGNGIPHRWTDDQLVQAVSKSKTFAEVIRALGLKTTAAGNWQTVQKHISRLGLSTDHFLGKAWVSDVSRDKPNKRPLSEYLVEDSGYSSYHLARRLVAEGYKEYRCEGESCGISKWHGKELPLELDHINGVHRDNRLKNLRLLCPNCHAQTETWRGRKNKKKAEALLPL